jgi:hypothetical protein
LYNLGIANKKLAIYANATVSFYLNYFDNSDISYVPFCSIGKRRETVLTFAESSAKRKSAHMPICTIFGLSKKFAVHLCIDVSKRTFAEKARFWERPP